MSNRTLIMFILTVSSLFLIPLSLNAQKHQPSIDSIAQNEAIKDEFELVLLCHCQEYLELAKYNKYNISPQGQKTAEGLVFSKYSSIGGVRTQYYADQFKASFFFKKGISVYYDKQFNFSILDSLYFKEMTSSYVQNNRDPKYKGDIGRQNIIFDCYYRVKRIPLETALKQFIELNRKVLE